MYGRLRSWKSRPENGAVQVMRKRIINSVLLTAPLDRHWLWSGGMVFQGCNEFARVPASRRKKRGPRRVLKSLAHNKKRTMKVRYRGLTPRNLHKRKR
jgi:hypothetical protein